MTGPDWKQVNKFIKGLNIPKDYWGIDFETLAEYQYNIYLSIRETAGKTTQTLILGLVLNKLWPEQYSIEYIRNDTSQITRANIEDLFNTVKRFDYIKKIYNNRWNDINYHVQSRKFFLCTRDENGDILEEDVLPVCIVHSLEKAKEFKSGYNNPRGNYILFDEFIDTDRATYMIFPEFLNAVSTIGRPGSRAQWLKVILIGNNTDPYSFWFDEFGISEDIPYLKFGGTITFKTEYNTTGCCRLLEPGEVQKKRLASKNIPFLGFPGKKAAAFTGATEWAGKTYRHPEWELDYDNCYNRRCYIKHRGRYIQLDLFKDEERGIYTFLHFAAPPKYDDNLILTIEPEKASDIYGFGKYEKRERIRNILLKYTGCYQENRFYYATNMVGSLTDDFIKNII